MRFFLLILVCLLAGPAMAQDAPITLTYQGSLADAGGQAISGVRVVTFRMYEQAEGGEARGGAGAVVARTIRFVTLSVFQLLRGWLKAYAR